MKTTLLPAAVNGMASSSADPSHLYKDDQSQVPRDGEAQRGKIGRERATSLILDTVHEKAGDRDDPCRRLERRASCPD
jgi:hypothetical protein